MENFGLKHAILTALVLSSVLFGGAAHTLASEQSGTYEVINLRAQYCVPDPYEVSMYYRIQRRIIDAFRKEYPLINPVTTHGLKLVSYTHTENMVPLMQIAGDIAPDVLYVYFSKLHTYIQMNLLYPLDIYVEDFLGATVKNGPLLSNDEYVEALSQGSNWQAIKHRVPRQSWDVMRQECPYPARAKECPYLKEWAMPVKGHHWHVWAFPIGPVARGLQYDRLLFAEHTDEGIEQRAPRDWDELLRWGKILTNPAENEFGLQIVPERIGNSFIPFLYSAGGKVVELDSDGRWRYVMDTEEAVEAAYFYARLRLEKIKRNNQVYRGIIAQAGRGVQQIRNGMQFTTLDERFLFQATDLTKGFGPVPVGPTGIRGSDFDCQMLSIFSGLADDKRRRDASWALIRFYDGEQARRVRTEMMIEEGMGRFVRPYLIEKFNSDGRYDDILRSQPKEIEEAYRLAFSSGVPVPYGKNCQQVYDEMARPLGAIWSSDIVRKAIDANDPETAKAEIREILQRSSKRINKKMLGILSPAEQRKREIVAWVVVISVVIIFSLVLRRVFRIFTPKDMISKGRWQFGKFKMAYILMAPAVLSIAVWLYWPLFKGTIIAFQNYSVLGDSVFIGIQNFSEVLYDEEFWYSLRISLTYALLFMVFGFCAPIGLAFLLQEVPRGKILFRTIYYLPAVLTGVVVIFLWRSFYSSEGLINQVLNSFIFAINGLFYHLIPLMQEPIVNIHQNWLQNHTMALFFCLLPTIWAGMGPGCLIYLAALKTVPEEIYEAADIDGAGISAKIFHIAIPTIKALVIINFIGAMIGSVRGASGFILAMTGGGPYSEQGGATEVIGLKLFYTTFGYLKFGTACAMAWVLGSMLIGFTVMQLQRLSKMEFKTVKDDA